MSRIILIFLFILAGCSGQRSLAVESDFVDQSYLASERVLTPDPQRSEEYKGQILSIKWSLHEEDFKDGPCKLTLVRRYTGLAQEIEDTKTWDIMTEKGYWQVNMLGDVYEARGPALLYHAKMETAKGKELACWRHIVWPKPCETDKT